MSVSNENRFNSALVVDYLLSEILAFPLASVCSFTSPVDDLDPRLKSNAQQRLWRDAEKHILRMAPDVSVDMVVGIRDQFWYGEREGSQEKQGLHTYLARIAEAFLNPVGQRAEPRFVSPSDSVASNYHGEFRTRLNTTLRWFSFAFPVDMFLGALKAEGGPPCEVGFLAPQILTMLRDKGVAEPHLHLGGAMAFPEFWVLTLHRLAQWGLPENLFKSPGAEFGEGRGLSPWLLRGALVRILLARFLFSRGTARSVTFLAWLERLFLPGLMGEYGIMGRDRVALLLREMSFGRKGAFGFVESFWSELYRQLGWGGTPSRLPTDPERLFLWDPIARFMMYSPGRDPSPEILFVQRGVQYLKDSAKPDPLFSRLFFQVLRLRCIYYRHVVQRPMTPGLLWFVRHYGRNKPGRDWASGALAVRFAAQSCGFGKGLRSLEVRTVPKDSVRAMLSLLKGCVTAVNGMAAASGREGPPEFGLVIHFAKARGKEAVKGIPHGNWKGTHADPAPMNETRRSRYSGYYRQQRQRGMTLARTLVRFPFSLQLIRGMDICTDELGVPSWVFVPIFRYIRDAGNETSIYLRSAYGKEVPPLRTTIHTGEDFVHLLGGLRRVEETLRYFDLGPGDRIGHGMALGTDPEAWVAKKDRVVMTREDRLFDLVWEWGRYSTGQLPCPGSRSSFLEREIARLSTKIFPESKTPYEMALLLDDLHDEQMMKNVGYPECEKIRVPDKKDKSKIERLVFLFHYLTCKLCFDRGHETEWVHLGPEVEPMQQLQKYIREKVASEGIVVEVNPTSNLLIGNLTDLAHHPFWRLKSPVDKSDGPSVALCIGSDDPLTFATDLRQEYVLLYESLVEGGLASSDAWEWVEQVRETGMNSRFTLPVEHVQNQNGGGPSYFVYPQKYVRFGTDQLLSPMP